MGSAGETLTQWAAVSQGATRSLESRRCHNEFNQEHFGVWR